MDRSTIEADRAKKTGDMPGSDPGWIGFVASEDGGWPVADGSRWSLRGHRFEGEAWLSIYMALRWSLRGAICWRARPGFTFRAIDPTRVFEKPTLYRRSLGSGRRRERPS
jgi:hypothetical protein